MTTAHEATECWCGALRHRIRRLKPAKTARQLAAPPMHAATGSWRGTSAIPRGVRLDVTAPHDCRNHVREFEDAEARNARLLVEAGK